MSAYLRSTKSRSQSLLPMCSAECDGITGTALAGPALPPASCLVPSALWTEAVAAGLQKGLSLWMEQPGNGEALIPANKLRAVYA
jgi:hypothetical protein